jgi:ATP-dependent DNA ligase
MTYLNLKPVEFDALSVKKRKAFDWSGRILLPKYDGCFAMVAFWNGEPNFIMSRTGETVKSMDHIYDDLFIRYPWLNGREDGGVMILGEAWTPGLDFNEISGMFRRQSLQVDLGFAPFDMVHYRQPGATPELWSKRPYIERLYALRSPRARGAMVVPPVVTLCEGQEHAMQYARSLKDVGGYDGAICADPYASYTPGAGKGGEFIKVKPLVSYSLECIGYESAVGAKTGRATGCLLVRFKGGTCGVATGLSEAQQADLKQFVGKIIEVEAMGASAHGLLREPRFKGVRTDVTKADY